MQLFELLQAHIRRRLGHQATGLLGFGEGDGVADRLLARQQHHHAIEAEGQAAVGRGPHVEGFHQETELAVGLLQGQADRFEHLALQGRIVDAQGAAAQFQAIEHQVIGLGPGRGQGGGPLGRIAAEVGDVGGAEGMVQRFEAVFAGVELEHREINHPKEVPGGVGPIGGHQAQLLGQELAHPVEGLVHRGRVAGTEQDQGAGHGAGALEQFGLGLGGEVVLDGANRVDLAALAHPNKGQAAGSGLLGLTEHIAAGFDPHVAEGVIAAGHGDALHRPPGRHGAGEHLEAHAGHQVAHVHQLHAVAGVGPVGAVAIHGLVPGEAREGLGQLNALHGLPDRTDQLFVEGQDLLLVHEAHLHVQLGELRLAIGAQVFVAEAAGHLVIALQAAHHQQLLEQLGRLGQGEPFATTNPRGHQVIAGAFGGGAGQHRRFHLDEALLFEEAAGGLDREVTQAQVAVHALAAQIQVAVAQTQLLAGVLLVVHRHREGQRALHRVEHGDGAGQHLDMAGGQALVERFGRAGPHPAPHLQHRFAAQVFGHGEGFGAQIRIHRDLHRAAAVAQVDENHAAMVAAPVHPAAQAHVQTDDVLSQITAQIAAPVAAHGRTRNQLGIFPWRPGPAKPWRFPPPGGGTSKPQGRR